jgi:hypothetical protein
MPSKLDMASTSGIGVNCLSTVVAEGQEGFERMGVFFSK